jgi:RNA polymerase sigma factor (TIGR02999 family)
MPDHQSAHITDLLAQARQPDETVARQAVNRIAELILPDLERIASSILRSEKAGQTLQTGDLVNEVYLKLKPDLRSYKDTAHFKAYAAKLMRWKLIEKARKRAGQGQKVSLDVAGQLPSERESEASLLRAIEFTRIDDALEKLSRADARAASVAEMKFFGGLTVEEIAEAVGVSVSTVKKDWRFASSVLKKELSGAVVGLLNL